VVIVYINKDAAFIKQSNATAVNSTGIE